MVTSAPVVVLVHGAFHPPHLYRGLIEALRGRGCTVLAPPLPTTGLDDSVRNKTYLDDVRRIHESLLPQLDAGKEAVVVCHSLGGIAGSAATENQTVVDRRERGLPGGVRAIVYIAAVALARKGGTFLHAVRAQLPTFYDADGPYLKCNEAAAEMLYSTLGGSERSEIARQLVYQSLASVSTRVHFVAANVCVPKTYIQCTMDKVIPAPVQRQWAEEAGCETIRIESDHSPFLQDDTTSQVVDIIINAVTTARERGKAFQGMVEGL